MVDTRGYLQQQILRLAGTTQARRLVQAPRVSRDVFSRFIASESTAGALDVGRSLVTRGRVLSLSVLVSEPSDETEARRRRDFYRALVGDVARAGLAGAGTTEVSLPLTVLGAGLGWDGMRLAHSLARNVCQAAGNAGVLVTIETESVRGDLDSTLHALLDLRQDFPDIGVSLPASRRRTVIDCADLAVTGSRVRLTKGFPDGGADRHPDWHAVDRAFVRGLRVLLEGSGYVSVGTHDLRILAIAEAMIRHLGRSRDNNEYHMRYGVRPETQISIADRGDRMRVYLPFGPDWYPYLWQRVVEQPANLLDLVKAAVSR